MCCWASQGCAPLCWWCSDHHFISVLFHTLFYFCLVFPQKMYWWNNDAVSHLLSTPNPHFNRDVRTQTRPVGRSFKRTGSPPAGHREIDIFTSRIAWMIKRFFLSLVYILLLLHTQFETLPTRALFPPFWLTLEWRHNQWSCAKDQRWTCRFFALRVCQTSPFALNCMFISTTDI